LDTNWQHQKKAITTDQKNRTDDEHIHEQDKEDLEVTRKQAKSGPPASAAKHPGEGVGSSGKGE
jgi:hypothetical protein